MTPLFLQACVVAPRTTEVYDAQCQITTKQMTLEPVQAAALKSCQGAACAAQFAIVGVTTAIAGTVVIAGNAMYWLEKQGRCEKKVD